MSTPSAKDPTTWHRVSYTSAWGYGKAVVLRTETTLVEAFDTYPEAEAKVAQLRRAK